MKQLIVVIMATMMLAGCAGRDARPVSAAQAGDDRLSCRQISAEIAANEQRAAGLSGERSDKTGRNVAIGLAGAVLFWPALFAIDLGEAEKTEANALDQRNQHLNVLAARKGC